MNYIDILNLFKKEYYDFGSFKLPIPDENFVKTQDLLNNYMDILHNALFPDDYSQPYAEGSYEIPEMKLKKGDLVIDAGANIGLFSAYACSKGCASIMFEPDPRPIYYIKQIMNLNPSFSLFLVEKALSDVIEFSKLRLSEKNGGSTIETDTNLTTFLNLNDFIIETTTIDNYMDEKKLNKLDFIKADIEGSEAKMLLGAEKCIKYFKPKLSLCIYHKENDSDNLEKIIKNFDKNYNVIKRYQKIYAWVDK